MTKEELVTRLERFYEPEGIGSVVFFILDNGGQIEIRQADIEDTAQPEVLEQYLNFLRRNIIDDEDKSIINLSSADDRANVIYEYDLEEIPSELEVIDNVLQNDNHQTFNFGNDDISNLKGFIILIGNNEHQLALYKKHYPISLFKRDSVLSFKVASRFTLLEEDVLKLNDSFEFFKIDDTLFILKLETLERFFGFHEIIIKEATENYNTLRDSNLLDNPEVLEEMLSDVKYARKLIKVSASSPVLGRIPNEQIIRFTKTHPALRNKFRYNESETRINLHTKKSKNLILKLLNDDYLHSELTAMYYDSIAKDSIESE